MNKEYEEYSDDVVELIRRLLDFTWKTDFSIFSLLVNNVGGLLLAVCKGKTEEIISEN